MSQLHHTLVIGDCRRMSMVGDCAVDLIVTSPPYWQLKDYGVANQIGFSDSYEQFINHLNLVWAECFRVLKPGCRMCVDIGDQFTRTAHYGRYKVMPIHSEIIQFCETIGFDYMGSIIWQKPTSQHTTGGSKVMGSYPLPKSGILKIDYEYILIFKKLGPPEKRSVEDRNASKLSDEEWQLFFDSHWNFNGDKQDKHIAVFPEELPYRLIRMFSFCGETVLDPFMGSGTTALAALKNGRNAIGYELNPDFYRYYQDKVSANFTKGIVGFNLQQDLSKVDIPQLIARLPYQFKDYRKLNRDEDSLSNTYGSVIRSSAKSESQQLPFADKPSPGDSEIDNSQCPTVLINHVDKLTLSTMLSTGICYVRIGDTKGSLTVTPGFAHMEYLLLHCAGENPLLFKLKKKGSFQIWTKETLVSYGFKPRSCPYYAVMKFNHGSPLKYEKLPYIKMGMATFVARLCHLKDFGVINS